MKVFAISLLVSLCTLSAWAAEEPPCSDALQIEKMHAFLLAEHREKMETQVAQWRYAVYVEQQKRKAVEQELADLKKKLTEKKPD